MPEPIVVSSAYRHGLSDEEILHALRNVLAVHEQDDLTMYVGAHPDGRPMEIGVVESAGGESVVVHAMEARKRYWPPMDDQSRRRDP